MNDSNIAMTQPIVEIKSLYKVFGKNPKSVLKAVKQGISKQALLEQTGHTIGLFDINLTINRGEVFVIMGLSGSGKSTLIRHFNRMIDPTVGEIIIDGQNIIQLKQSQLEAFRRHKIAMVFQNFGLMPHLNILDNVAYGLKINGVNKTERYDHAKRWINIVGLEGYDLQFPMQLSGGQKQRVGLARALAVDTDILLMDEPFSALDPLIRREMQAQLIELQSNLHKTIIFITHDLDEALKMGDRIAILKDGKIIQLDTPEEILKNPADDYVADFVRDVKF